MNADRLLANYERIADTPDAIARLRRFVLDLAVRGKLVPQNLNDEPASELLKRLSEEKARLLKAGEIRKPKPLPTVDESPFDLPQNWRWTRMREITSDHGQKTPNATFTYIDVTAIDNEAGIRHSIAAPRHCKTAPAARRDDCERSTFSDFVGAPYCNVFKAAKPTQQHQLHALLAQRDLSLSKKALRTALPATYELPSILERETLFGLREQRS
jgi:hypothetical protein